MKLNNQLTLQRLIGKIDNDFNISESDWIPRVAAWTIDALSQMKVLPMERKRRLLIEKKIASVLNLQFLLRGSKLLSQILKLQMVGKQHKLLIL